MSKQDSNRKLVQQGPGIYQFTNKKSGKVYVGQSRDPDWRIDCGRVGACRGNKVKCHKCSALLGSSLPLHNDIRELGWDAFDAKVLERCEPWDLIDKENRWIAERVNANVAVYNLTQVTREPNPRFPNDNGNPYILPEAERKRPRKKFRHLTTKERYDLIWLRDRGYPTTRICLLFDITPCGVSHAYNRAKRSV